MNARYTEACDPSECRSQNRIDHINKDKTGFRLITRRVVDLANVGPTRRTNVVMNYWWLWSKSVTQVAMNWYLFM